jgi:hypothetical protein
MLGLLSTDRSMAMRRLKWKICLFLDRHAPSQTTVIYWLSMATGILLVAAAIKYR